MKIKILCIARDRVSLVLKEWNALCIELQHFCRFFAFFSSILISSSLPFIFSFLNSFSSMQGYERGKDRALRGLQISAHLLLFSLFFFSLSLIYFPLHYYLFFITLFLSFYLFSFFFCFLSLFYAHYLLN